MPIIGMEKMMSALIYWFVVCNDAIWVAFCDI